jgi:hypothetical protein
LTIASLEAIGDPSHARTTTDGAGEDHATSALSIARPEQSAHGGHGSAIKPTQRRVCRPLSRASCPARVVETGHYSMLRRRALPRCDRVARIAIRNDLWQRV